jgi:hypothetical protein
VIVSACVKANKPGIENAKVSPAKNLILILIPHSFFFNKNKKAVV